MKNKVLKSAVAFGIVAVMAVTFTVNTNESNQIDSTLDNILTLNQASAEISGTYDICLDILLSCNPGSHAPRIKGEF